MSSGLKFETPYEIFRDISKMVHSSTDLEEVLELVVWKITQVLKAQGAIIRILNLQTGHLERSEAYGLKKHYLSTEPVSKHDLIIELCQRNRAVCIEDILNDDRIQKGQDLWNDGIRMILDIPLILQKDLVGILRTYFSQVVRFSSEELEFILAIVQQCSCAIDKTRLIEEQKSQYQQLVLHTEKLSALGRMAAGIAHEINNPLAGILLYSTNMAKKAGQNGPFKEGLEVIIRETIRCKGIIQDLLEFSRDKEPKKTSSSINVIIEKALSILRNEFRLQHIAVEKQLADNLPQVPLDENLMQQVLVNLLINAAEAIQDKGRIAIKSHLGPFQKKVIVDIEDDGCGIPPENMAQIFEPFFSTKGNGTGLGLAVSYGVVQKHQGNIQVSSLPGRGARFTIEIPISQQA